MIFALTEATNTASKALTPDQIMGLIFGIVLLVLAVALVVLVLFQSGKSAGLSGAIGGISESFVAKNKGRSLDAKLAKATKWVAIAFVVLTLILNIIG